MLDGQGQSSSDPVRVGFYATEAHPIIPKSIPCRDHVVPFGEDGVLQAVIRSITEDAPLAEPHLPSRLLDLGPLSSTGARSDLYLVDTSNIIEEYIYATLSHCWLRDQILCTRRDNLEAHKRCLYFDSLPQTFQEAIVVCRQLDIRYLWIDSLCIIQGDVVDWEREGAKMSSIYANSCATLAMHSGTGGAMEHKDIALASSCGQATATVHTCILPLFRDLLDQVLAAPIARSVDEVPENGRWNKVSLRGWCYQERVLSRRVVHFTGQEVLIEQNGKIIHCQCGQHITDEEVGFAGWLERVRTTDYLANDAWIDTVSHYTQRMFSRQGDLLPGLAGVANRFDQYFKLGSYVAGMWEGELVRWLCWRTRPWKSELRGSEYCPDCRPWPRRIRQHSDEPSSRVPTFSWASRFGPCEFITEVWGDDFVPVADVIGVHCETSEASPFGIVRGGHVDLKGTIYYALHFSTTGKVSNEIGHSCKTDHAYIVDEGLPDRWDMSHSDKKTMEAVRIGGQRYDLDALDDIPEDYSPVYLLEMCKAKFDNTSPMSVMLVLQPYQSGSVGVESPDGTIPTFYQPHFRRVGIGIFEPYKFLQPMTSFPGQVVRIF
ncbi:hypothetical protein jhhlp_004876 [Lomentospora prolificans]|uniref:Heterokaryon incompatibility domain-containing protein n=1 Tax=Lomentospora prolificans TaxID=41688 RepID=A0A2N3N7Z9_9PEZI|nr:hypothetical protein jhhlp_004876 [Lomentospora prolificans]